MDSGKDDIRLAIAFVESAVGLEANSSGGGQQWRPKSSHMLTHLRAALPGGIPVVGDLRALERQEASSEAVDRVVAMADYLGRVVDGLYELAGVPNDEGGDVSQADLHAHHG